MMIDALTTAGPVRQSDISQDAGRVPADPTRRRPRVREDLIVQEWTVDWFFYGDPPAGLPRCLASELIAVGRSGADTHE